MSGLSFVFRIVRAVSRKKRVRGAGSPSSVQPGIASRYSGTNRLGGFDSAPRPWVGSDMDICPLYVAHHPDDRAEFRREPVIPEQPPPEPVVSAEWLPPGGPLVGGRFGVE